MVWRQIYAISASRKMNCHLTELQPATAKLILQPSISINLGLPKNPSQQSDADFMAVGVRYREASLTLDHIKTLAVPKRPGKPEFLQTCRELPVRNTAQRRR